MIGIFSQVKFQRLLLLVLVAAVYGACLLNGFVWDDNVFFIGNPVYKDFNLRAMVTSLANGVEYLPLRDITYAFDYLLWGERPFGFHLTNLLFFEVNVLLAYELSRLLLSKFARASGRVASVFTPFATALLFALHPINAEVVNFVTCRNVLVSGVFVFISIICIIKQLESSAYRLYLIALLAYVCAVLGKATALMLPLLLLGTLPLIFPRKLKRILLLLAPFFAVAAGFYSAFRKIAVKSGITDNDMMTVTVYSLLRKISLAAQIPFFYLKKLFLPYGFSVEYSTSFAYVLSSPKVIASIGVLVALAALAFALRRRFPEHVYGFFWFITALVPVLNFFGTYPIVADRYAYIPVFGFMLICAATMDRISVNSLKFAILLILAGLLSGVSVARTFEWKSGETLWTANIRNNPENAKGYLAYGTYLFNSRDYQKSLTFFSNNSNIPWLKIYHDYYKGYYLLLQGNRLDAKKLFLTTLDYIPGFVGSLYHLGEIAESEGDYFTASQYFNKGLSSSEKDLFYQRPAIREKVAAIKRSWLDNYLRGMRQKADQSPADANAIRDLALTLDRLCFFEEALLQYQRLDKMGVKSWQLYQNIANCYFNLNKNELAVRYYERVVAANGGDEDTFDNLGIAYRRLERYDKSALVINAGIRNFPASPFLAYNLAVTYYMAGNRAAARSAFLHVMQSFPGYKDRALLYLKELSN